MDLVAFGQLNAWADPAATATTELRTLKDNRPESRCVGVVWNEERDVREIRCRLTGTGDVTKIGVQYWAHTWPSSPPEMPTMEDPVDDPWQGRWIDAKVERTFNDGVHVFRFQPLDKSENERADNLPGVTYRRTLKMRLVLPTDGVKVDSIAMFSGTVLKPVALRIELGCGEPIPATWNGRLEVDNGILLSAKPWNFDERDRFELPYSWKNVRTGRPKGIVAEVLAAASSLPGSNDITVVTVRATASTSAGVQPRTFSFNTHDLRRGPIYVPDLHAMVTKADDPRHFAADYPARGRTIRDQMRHEPEQTFDRATREIPPQDPWERQYGDRLYLPLAADASWQKFALELGGDVFISKQKAKGAELKRLKWKGDSLRFRIGTMRVNPKQDGSATKPFYREDRKARLSVAEDGLPIPIGRWDHDGLCYEQEAFVTLLDGPLDPNDAGRSEQTPAILMMQLRVSNPGSEAARAACVLTVEPSKDLVLVGQRVFDRTKANRLRAVIGPPAGAETKRSEQGGIVSEFDVAAGETKVLQLRIPYVSDLTDGDAAKIEAMDYAGQRRRVAQYWREMIAKTTRFKVPEAEFNHLARSVVPHIHISATKDPKSGLYMVPAASFGYDVYANESCFQALMLDAFGDTERAGQYLNTLAALQGSKSFPGNYSEPHDGVFHGARVDATYDYTAYHYGLDHGTILWTLAKHYSFTRDADWLKATLPHMLKAVEWIERQRAATKKVDVRGNRVPEYGLLPAGQLEDNNDWGYWFSVNAYCAAGMVEMAAAMREIGHPNAEQMQRQAVAFRDDLRAAVLRAAEVAPVARMRDGTYSPYVPTHPYQRFRYFGPLRVQYFSRYDRPDVLPCYRLSAIREALYGPMILLSLQLFDAHEPIADWILDDWEDNLTLSSSGGFNVHGFTDDKYWFSQGGLVFQSNLQNPVLPYLYRNEAPAAIRGMYNSFVSCLYPDAHVLAEEYRQWQHASGPFYKCPDEARAVNRVRDMLVLESGKDLMLASGAPRRWLAAKEGIQVDRVNSSFGPLGFSMRPGDAPKTIVVNVTPPTRNRPEHLWLYVRLPGQRKIESVEIDGKPWTEFDATRERIELPQTGKPLKITVR